VGAWSFDEASGTTVLDSSGRGNHGTVSGATRVNGKYGRALSFDGVNDLVTVADSASLDLTGAMTLEAWVKPTALGSMWRTVVIKEQPGQLSYALYAGNGSGKPAGHVFTTSDLRADGPAGVALKTWTHLATTYDGATLRLYVNGTQVASKAVTGLATTSGSPLRFGGNNVWPEWFKGQIDNVRIYSRALTAAEIGADRTAPVSGGSSAMLLSVTKANARKARARKARGHKSRTKSRKSRAKHTRRHRSL
jgi:hypothetical protein